MALSERRTRPLRPGECNWTQELDSQLIALNAERFSDPAIAERLGLRPNQVSKRRTKLGLSGWIGGAAKHEVNTDLIVKVREHFDADLTCLQSAQLLGLSRGAVSGLRARNGMKARERNAVKPRAARQRLAIKHGAILSTGRTAPYTPDQAPPRPGVPFCRHTGCKWPVGPWMERASADMLVCNEARAAGKPYCLEHVIAGSGYALQEAA